MKRTDLVDALKKVAPALSSKDLIPIFSCFCFDGKTVTAYDDVVALSLPLVWEVPGGLKGNVFLGWLNAARGQEVVITKDENKIQLKCGKSLLTPTYLPAKDFIFSFPDEPAVEVQLMPTFLEALEKCLVCMGEDPSKPWQAGITVDFSDKSSAVMYSTNGLAAARCVIDLEVGADSKLKSLLLPPRFCQLLNTISSHDMASTLLINKSWVEVKFASGLRLFSRVGKDAAPENFLEIFSAEFDEKVNGRLKEIPKGFDGMVERSIVILENGRQDLAKFIITEGRIEILATSSAGEVHDAAKFPDHPEMEVEASPKYINSGMKYATSICIIKGRAIVLSGESFTYMTSVATSA